MKRDYSFVLSAIVFHLLHQENVLFRNIATHDSVRFLWKLSRDSTSCCHHACQILKRCHHLAYQSHRIETSLNLTTRLNGWCNRFHVIFVSRITYDLNKHAHNSSRWNPWLTLRVWWYYTMSQWLNNPQCTQIVSNDNFNLRNIFDERNLK